jgi:hypothetical protein
MDVFTLCEGRSHGCIHSVWRCVLLFTFRSCGRALSCMYSQCGEGTFLYVFTVCGGVFSCIYSQCVEERSAVCINSVSKGALFCMY